MPDPLRLVFAGTPEFAAHSLQALLGCDVCNIVAVYSQPDRRRGRGKKLSPSPVKALAQSHDIPVYQPVNFKQAGSVDELAALQADVMVVAAYGLLLPEAVLQTPKLGCINIHASLLPRWRGAAPIERAIEAGDSETGITIMQMDAGLDTGAMLLKSRCDIGVDDNGDDLRARLAELGGAAIVEALQKLQQGELHGQAQDNQQACYAKKVLKAECELDWSQPAELLQGKIRAFYSAYTCYSVLDGQRIKIGASTVSEDKRSGAPGCILQCSRTAVTVACGSGNLELTALQLPGSRMLAARDVLNGRAEQFAPGNCFTAAAGTEPG